MCDIIRNIKDESLCFVFLVLVYCFCSHPLQVRLQLVPCVSGLADSRVEPVVHGVEVVPHLVCA